MKSNYFVKINTSNDIVDLLIDTFFVKMKMAPNPDQVQKVCDEYNNDPEGKDYFVIYKQKDKWKSNFFSKDQVELL